MEIRQNIIKKGKRGIISRAFHSKNDKEVITAWKSDLNGALLIFNVSFVLCVGPPLRAWFQTELVINIHVDVVDTRTAVADVHHDVKARTLSYPPLTPWFLSFGPTLRVL